jgi:isocitrate dehydrogenase (NAD+)
VTLVHKANILKNSQGLFLDVGRLMAREYSKIEFEEVIVDAMAMNLVLKPERYDVIVTTNLFGDILSDLISGLVGGLGLAPARTSGSAERSSRRSTGRRPTSRARGSPIRAR